MENQKKYSIRIYCLGKDGRLEMLNSIEELPEHPARMFLKTELKFWGKKRWVSSVAQIMIGLHNADGEMLECHTFEPKPSLKLRKKITLKEFFEDVEEELAIHCETKEQANILMKEFDKLGHRWGNGYKYCKRNNFFKENLSETGYTNYHTYGNVKTMKKNDVRIFKFKNIILGGE